VAHVVASGFGSGHAPVAPGTFGALLGIVIGALVLAWTPHLLPLAVVLAVGGGIWAIAEAGGSDDPGWIVIDEIAGQLAALLPLGRPSPLGLLLAFALFRAFDITKPGLIGTLDRRHDAIGVMGDDVAAGLLAAVIVWGAIYVFPNTFR
jgi:phosphatidylglycerophosphatase A